MIRARPLLMALTFALPCALAGAEECKGFKWDVSREQALFTGKSSAIMAGTEEGKAPGIQPDKLYDVALAPQEQVHLVAKPGKTMIPDGASAGLLRVRVAKAGTYRVAVSQAFWIDVVSAGSTLASLDFSGSHDCERPRKIVVYELPADRELFLPLSGPTDAHVLLSVTLVSARP